MLTVAESEKDVFDRMVNVKKRRRRKPDASFSNDSAKRGQRKAKMKAFEFQSQLLAGEGKGISSEASTSTDKFSKVFALPQRWYMFCLLLFRS